MHIILEGLDKVGKTTLANFLSEQLKMPIKKFSAPKNFIVAPVGFDIDGDVNADNEEEVLNFCKTLSNDPKFQDSVAKDSHDERLDFLMSNGFEIEAESPFVLYSEFLVNESVPHIIDRFYMSELAYGPVKRGFSEIDNVRKALLESMCKEINTFNVYCHAPVKDIEARFTTDKETFLTVDEIKPIAENFMKEIERSKLVWRPYQIGDSMQNISDFYLASRDEVQ